MEQKENIQAQVEGIATLLVLDDEIRKLSSLREFAFFSINETHRLISYHTAYIWQKNEIIGTSLIMQSGTAEIDVHAPVNQWIKRFINHTLEKSNTKKMQVIDKESPDWVDFTQHWPEILPPHLLWCPLLDKNNQISGGLLFFRETPFTADEIKMLSWLISSYQYTWNTLTQSANFSILKHVKKRPYFVGLLIAVMGILLFPTRLSVLGTGIVIPADPVMMNAPMEGIIKSISVNPGNVITTGQLLFSMDKTDLQSNFDVNEKDVLLTKAKLRSVINESFTKSESNAEIPILQAQLAVDQANLDYTKTMLQKADIRSPIDGIVIFDNKDQWIGQPVHAGERILVVANPKKVALKINLPVADSIKLQKGASGEFFLYGTLNPMLIKVTILGYNAKIMPNRILSYQLNAEFISMNDIPQIGSEGTVKVYGRYVPFIYYLLRKPLQTLREDFGI